MWDSTNGSRCYQWKLAERYRSVFHDHSNSQNVSYLGDRTCLCWVKINKILGFCNDLKTKWGFNRVFDRFKRHSKGFTKGVSFINFVYHLTVVRTNLFECFYILSHWGIHLVSKMGVNPKENVYDPCPAISS